MSPRRVHRTVSVLVLLVVGFTAPACSGRGSLVNRAADQTAAKYLVELFVLLHVGADVAAAASTYVTALPDRSLEERIARGCLMFDYKALDPKALSDLVTTRISAVVFNHDLRKKNAGDDWLQKQLSFTADATSLVLASDGFAALELKQNASFTDKDASDVARMSALVTASKDWAKVKALHDELKAKLVPILEKNSKLAEAFDRPISNELKDSRARIVALISDAAKQSK